MFPFMVMKIGIQIACDNNDEGKVSQEKGSDFVRSLITYYMGGTIIV